ncbi:hypothetical protein EXS70_00930 [Candidatus Peribacteria bacterium]|nr:hypothetical protein [Candidatus Peribacteria bacterium]
MRLLRLLLPAIALLVPATAYAQYGIIGETVNNISGFLPFMYDNGMCSGSTACGFIQLVQMVVGKFRPLLTVIAVVVMVIYGYRMIIGQEDDILTKARTVMSSTIAGLIMVWLIDPFIAAFYGTTGEVQQGNIDVGVGILTTEVNGVVNWVLMIVASLAVLILILTALKAIGQSTGEEAIGNIRKTIFSVAAGLILLVMRFVLSGGFVESTGNPAPILAAIMRPVSYIMGFLGLAALIVVVYAGFSLVLSMGSEEAYTKSKSLLVRAAIGSIIIMMSLAIVNFVIIPGVQ